MLVHQDSTDLGECFSACTISGTAMDVEEVFDDDLPISKIRVCENCITTLMIVANGVNFMFYAEKDHN